MKRTENECVDCGLPCLGSSCKYRNVTRFYCDECREEKPLYYFGDDDEELCIDCIEMRLNQLDERGD